jgi:trimeric autotransporter adhesin
MKKIYLAFTLLFICFAGFGQLTGIKTIPGDYATISAAITALNTSGVGAGGVTFNVTAGYTETASNLMITATGTLANPIVFQKSGTGTDPLITASAGVSTTMDGIIILRGTDYITFNGIDLKDPATNTTSTTQMEWGYALLKNSATDGCQNVLITNCTITLQRIYASSVGIYVANHLTTSTAQLTVTATSGANSSNKFYSNVIQNVTTGISILGFVDTTPYTYYDQNNDVGGSSLTTGNTIQDFGGIAATTSTGVYVGYQNGCNISYNTVNNIAGGGIVSANILYGIRYSTALNAIATINNNNITLSQGANASIVYGISSGISGTGTLSVNTNTFSVSYTAGASGVLYCIYCSTAMTSTTFSGNQFISCTNLNTTGSIYFISNSVTTPTVTVSNNTMNAITKPSAGGIVYGYYNTASPTGGIETINSNTISNIILTGATSFYGICSSNNTTTQNKSVYYNIITGITCGSSIVEGILITAGNTVNIYGNTVNTITTGNGGTGGSFVYGYNLGSSFTVNASVYSNAAFGISNSNTGATYGMCLGGGTSFTAYKNNIYNLTGTVAASVIYGYYETSVIGFVFYNNFVSNLLAPLASNLNAVSGIYIISGTGIGLYNNTVYLNASSTAATFGTSGIYTSSTPTVDMKNNIVVNTSTPIGTGGITAAYRRSSSTLSTYATTCNNNDFYAGTPSATNLLFSDGTNSLQTLSALKSFLYPRETQSVSENPPFVNVTTTPYDLHLKTTIATSCESGGTTVSSPIAITSDYDGDARYPNGGYPNNVSYPATGPDIGADEFAGIPLDVNGPTINYTIFSNTSSTSARTLTATITDVSGVPVTGTGLPRLYWKINSGAWNPVAGTSIGGNQYTFIFGTGVVLNDVVSYYIVAQDNDTPTPLSSANPSVGASGYSINPPAVSTPPTTPNTYTIIGALCGSYNVGVGKTYTTLTAAVTALNAGEITCPVVLLLTDATYASESFPITINPLLGSSSTNTVTISPANGVTPTITGSSATGILNLNGADYVIIDGSNSGGTDKSLTWENTDNVANAYTIGFSNSGGTDPAKNNIIRNCNIKASSQVSTTTYGIYMNSTGGAYDNTIINNNTIYSAKYGILFSGASTAVANNGQITNNIIGSTTDATSIQYRGITVQYANGTVISGNEIMGAPAGNSNYYQAGIYVTTGSINTKIRKNKIHDWYYAGTGGWGNYGIYYGSDASTVTEISNNIIYLIKGDGYLGIQTDNPYGIYIASGGNCGIYNNSISMTGAYLSTSPGAFSACISINAGITLLDIRNNIFRNSMTASSGTPADFTYAIYSASANTAFTTINNNDYWDDGLGANIGYLGANQATLANWQTASVQDAASLNLDPAFLSMTDLHPTSTTLGKTGVTISSITDDYSGTLRMDPPDPGAYQFSSNPVITTTAATAVTCGSVTLNGTITANGANVTSGFDYGTTISYGSSVAGTPSTVNGTTPVAISATIPNMIPNVINHYRAKGISGGLTTYGSDMTATPPCPPTVATTAATSITSSTATMNGTVNPNNLTATVSFDWGLTIAYGNNVAGVPGLVTGGIATTVSSSLTGLTPGVTYHYRVNGINSVGTSNGIDMTFTTLPAPPTMVTMAATSITNNTATLNGTALANGASTTVQFDYGLTAAYGLTISAVPSPVTGNTITSETVSLTGLTCNTLFHYRIRGINSTGQTSGNDMTFTTSGALSPPGTITGPTSVCQGATNVTYTVPPITGATNYVWTVPVGSTIISGGNTNSIMLNFSLIAVSGNVVVYGTNSCMNSSSSSLSVIVHVLPIPTITGPASACVNSTGSVYTTETNMSAYTWSVSSGGVITAGSGTNSITVTWNMAGAQTVSVNYTNTNNCMASTATIKDVNINALPVPTITGLASVCAGTTGVTYSTETGMTGYTWTLSAGGTITAGAGSKTITATWITPGAQTVSVNYTNTNGCTGSSPTVKNVTVNSLPVPTITGSASVCVGSYGNVYTTETGMTGYMWSLSTGGIITSGTGTNSITVTWSSSGNQTVGINYTNANGCVASIATVKNVTVNPLPVPTITGPTSVCVGTSVVTYSTETGMTGYNWSLSTGGTITSGIGTASISVNWNTAGAQTVSVNYVNLNGCTANNATIKNVTINPLPVPAITGASSVCVGSTGVAYYTQTGMTNYFWSVSSGGLITAGTGTSSILVTWSTVGSQNVYVNYTNSNGCTATSPTAKAITVNLLPVPTITGAGSVCAGTTGVNYSTEVGMTGYTWSVSSGGIIVSGAGTNQVTVAWPTAGTQTISVGYTNTNGCTSFTPTIKNVVVNPVYIPTINGTNTICLNTQSYVYTTEAGMTNYTWVVSSGGTIIAGGNATSHTVTVRWNTTGSQYVSVNYSNGYGCTAGTATVYQVSINPVPVPSITGTSKVCVGTTGVVYTTQSGMTNYIWSVSLGGTITAGGTSTSNTVTVTWNIAGSQSLSCNYSNSYGCTATVPATFGVTVYALPQVTLTGLTSVCAGTAGNVYTTQTGMTGYTWIVSAGGTITAGGTSTSSTVTVTWNTAGTRYVSVNYHNSNGCSASQPATVNVIVNAQPVPTITGPSSLCSGISGLYSTETGKTSYAWTVSTGGTIVSGGTSTSSTITVKWTTTGSQWVRVNYSNSTGCRATNYTQYSITVNPLPVPVITGTSTVCQGTSGVVYTTQTGMTGYTWTTSTGGTITAGTGTNSITVSWTGYGAQWVGVNYSNSSGCTAATAPHFAVTVNQATVPTLSGVFSVCNNTNATYSTDPNKSNYVWVVSSGGTITSGASTRTVVVHWNTAGANYISVTYVTTSGCPVIAPTVKTVTVNGIPTPTITGPVSVCLGAYQWYVTEGGMTNYQWTLGGSGGIITSGFNSHQIYVEWTATGAKTVSVNYTTPGGCTAPNYATLNVNVTVCGDSPSTGTDDIQAPIAFSVYPNPNNGKFTALIECECQDNCSIDVFNMMGIKVFEIVNLNMESKMEVPIDLQNLPQGIYSVVFRNSDRWLVRKIVINN